MARALLPFGQLMQLPANTPVLVNSKSGYLAQSTRSAEEPLRERLREAGITRDPLFCGPEQLADALRAERDAGSPIVILGGGDGTIAMATSILIGSETALGILPMGTMNLLARDLELPLDPLDAFDALSSGNIEGIDVGKINDEIFLCAAILGFFPAAAARAKDYHGRNPIVKAVQTIWIFVTGFLRARPLRLQFCIGEEHHSIKTRLVVIANNPFAKTAELVPTKADLHTGRLAIYVSRHSGIGSMLKGTFLFLIGKYHADREMQIVETEALDIHRGHRHELRVMIDGEHRKMTTPLKVELVPSKLRVVHSGHGSP